jgi:methyl-accepting chemotaxis protein
MSRISARTRLAATLGTVLLASTMLSACGSDTTDTAPLSANAQWADGVCGAYADLESAVSALGDPLPESTGPIADRVTAAKDAIQGRVDTVQVSVAGLTAAVTDVPPEADTSLQTARDNLKTAVDDVRPEISEAQTALQAAVENPSVESISALATAATTLATKAGEAAQQGKDSLSQAKGAAQTAFKEAPACQPFING